MKVLIVTRHYLDENNGGSNCSKANIRALAELYSDCTLIYPERENRSSESYIPAGVNTIPCYDHRNRFQKGVDVYLGILHRFTEVIANHLAHHKYDMVVLDHSVTANGVIGVVKKSGSKIVTIHHNNESQYIRDNKPSLIYRWPYVRYSERAERDALLMSDLNITLSEKDAREFRKRFLGRDIHCHNMGTFQYQDLPKKIQDDSDRECRTFAITGSLNFLQSQLPVIEFVERYFPLLLHKIPEAHLIVAGRNPSKQIEVLCSRHKNVTLIPNPIDINLVIRQADIYVCPTNMGSGVKLRVMDGLKLGLPVLGHTISLNGYETIKKDGYFFDYNDEDSFINALDSIVGLNYKRQAVYESFLSYFSYESGKKRLQAILKEASLL